MHSNTILKNDLEKEREQTALEALLEKVAEDAKQDPRAFLQETIVPEGGE